MRLICTLSANLSALAGGLQIKHGPHGVKFYRVDYDVCIYFGGTQLHAKLQWKEGVSAWASHNASVLTTYVVEVHSWKSGYSDALCVLKWHKSLIFSFKEGLNLLNMCKIRWIFDSDWRHRTQVNKPQSVTHRESSLITDQNLGVSAKLSVHFQPVGWL